MVAFVDRLVLRQRELKHPLCVGLDPHLDRIPAAFRAGTMTPDDPVTVEVVERFFREVIDRLAGRVASVKPQIAFFEQLGWRGLRAFEHLVERCHERELLVVIDAKRGDIGSTAAGYARAYFGPTSALSADALTVNAYLGLDTLEPFVEAAAGAEGGLFVLVKTSNPGSGDLQALEVDGRPVYLHLATALGERAAHLVGKTGFSGLGAVVGATYPEDAKRVREVMPEALLLVPGFGAQGASAADAVSGFVRGDHGLEGGLVNASRSVVFPSADHWAMAFDAALSRAIDELGAAVT